MEELHRIHKEVPFGYWVVWVEPAWRALRRRWAERKAAKPAAPRVDEIRLASFR